MKSTKLSVAVFWITLFLTAGTALTFEKVGTTSFQFLKVMTDARSTGMGEAYSAVVNSANAVFWNPAALTKVQKLDVSVSYLDWLLDISHSSFAAAYSVFGLGTFGLQGLFTNVGEIEVTTVDALGFVGDTYNPGLTGEKMSPASLVLGLSFARDLTDKLAFGLTSKFVQEDLVVKKVSAIVFDGGLTFRTGFRSLEMAVAVRHFGQEVQYYEKSYPLPQTFTIGVSGMLISGENGFFLPSKTHAIRVAYDMSQPRDYDQQHHVGLEYSLKDFIFLRGGYKFNFDEEGLSLGFGLRRGGFTLDYSYCQFGEYFDSVHRFSFGFSAN